MGEEWTQLPCGETEIKDLGGKGETLGSAVHFECNPSCSGKGDFLKHLYCFVIILGCWTEICKCNPASGNSSDLLVSCIYC